MVLPEKRNRQFGSVFWNKKTCEKYIRENFQGELKRSMLKELRETHGRAKLYNVFG